jgi:protoporphyrin/coproporphyrin ferrochelatase
MQKSPALTHSTPQKMAVVLLNLGTPSAPTPSAVRRYLKVFLSDRRVVEIPRAVWLPLLHGIILPIRGRKSAEKYASIWTKEGSPLKVWTEKQAKLLQGNLGERGHKLTVRYAMSYDPDGRTQIEHVLDELHAENTTRILFLPLYPQYSATTTAAAFDSIYRWGLRSRRLPEFRFINRYHDDAGYIEALRARVAQSFLENGALGAKDKLVLSFHGVPARTLELGDIYHCECHKTARLLTAKLGLAPEQVVLTFQSRLGRAKWLEPYTEPTLRKLAKDGVPRVDVFCPGFTSDHLETLEEISMEAKEAFTHEGGKTFNYIPALNDSQAWITAMGNLCEQHLQGWPSKETSDPAALAATAQRAKTMGARN